MQIFMHRKSLVLAAVVLAAPVLPAFAQSTTNTSGPYIGASIGKPDWRTDATGGVTSGSSGGTGYKLYGGYQINPNFALELGGVKLGRLSGTGGEAKARAVYLDAVGLYPLSQQWALLGRVGVARTHVSAPNGNDSGTNAKFGAGVQYSLNRNVSIRTEWERYKLTSLGAKPNADLWSVGLNYAF